MKRFQSLPVSVPGLRAARWASTELYSGMKETYSVARVESGRSAWWTSGKIWESGPGSLQIKQPGDVHRDVARDGRHVLSMITFPTRVVEDVIGRVRVHPHLCADDARGAPFQRLHDAVLAGADRLALDVAVTEAIEALAGVGDAKCEHTLPVRRAVDLLHARLDEPITLDELADHAELDKFHLCRAFRSQVGLPPHAYLTRLRIMRAKELLAAGKKAGETALAVGFYDQSQMNRHFRRIVGATPVEYARGL